MKYHTIALQSVIRNWMPRVLVLIMGGQGCLCRTYGLRCLFYIEYVVGMDDENGRKYTKGGHGNLLAPVIFGI